MNRLLIAGLTALPLLAGCSLFRTDPVPPASTLVGVQGQDAAWADAVERSPDGGAPTFTPLTEARDAVEAAREQPQVETHGGEPLAQAETALSEAESGWNEIADVRRRDPDALAAVANAAHRAQRLAEIARFTAVREINLEQLVEVEDRLQQRQRESAPVDGSGDSLIGQRVVPDRLGGISFETGTARMTDGAREVVRRLADLVRDNESYGVAVFGHTDNVAPADSTLQAFVSANEELEEQAPTRGEKVRAFNLALSAARARAVARALVDNGVPARRIGARGFGDTRPVASNDTAEGRAANRRIEAVIVPGPDTEAGRRQQQRAAQPGGAARSGS
ncbi:hypothetical protein SAOR_02620 [Salinisphaera orenii MK-B5]|uniref:OmpA-like domain-containing protein n=1 Tax=Salinisphaera orenii MK-B5 TaxID=856730 RepID=A0A423PW17_9GAMM|nr:OmpA family protein [Salinisphaera orenii]ROO29751.1 hypothetical protein SAOR_02620 [Salinisphaera orenii MK-B5]